MIPLLVGLTNSQSSSWTSPEVGGLLVLAGVLIPVFLFIEWRAREPIVPLDLFRDRTYAGSILATFFAAFGFFSATIFLPRFYQVVKGDSATASGYALFPLLLGVIIASVISGQIVARTGKYKVLLLASVVLVGLGSFLFTNLAATSDPLVISFWQFILGVGIGPTLAVFTIVVQNAVPFSKLGVATSSIAFFRQIGGTVGLSIAGSLFGTQVAAQIPARLLVNGVPQSIVTGFQGGGFDQNSLLGVGTTLGQQILAVVPAAARQSVEPFVPKIVTSIYEAISLSIGFVFWLGLAASALALLAVFIIREVPLRSSLGPVAGEAHGTSAPPRPGAEGMAPRPALAGE
jgi:MFS family permease